MKRLAVWLILTGMAATMIGCAGGGMTRQTEPGYVPTHVTIGEVFSYNRQPSVSHQDIQELAIRFTEEAMYEQGVHYIPVDELAGTGEDSSDYVVLELSLTFQEAYRQTVGEGGLTVRCEYTLRRGSDNMIYATGSAGSSDWMVSSGASLDSQRGVEYACKAAVKEIKEIIENDKAAPAQQPQG